jgi:hypothetical protein
VVCRPDALKQVRAEIGQARRHGIELRPTQVVKLSKRSARALLRTNEKLFARCRYRSIQPAVNDSHNNDRVVIMPGVYTEPASRAVPAFPAECDKYRTTSDHGSGAVSYEYQDHCPNAQALVAVIGRALGPGTDPRTTPFSRPDPHGIPNTGSCWYSNRGPDGSEKSLTADPPMAPISGTSLPKFLPMDCANSVGAGDPVKEGMLMGCLAAIGTGNWDGSLCEWFAMPAKPGSAAALEQQKRFETLSQRYAANPLSPQRYCTFSGGETGSLSCDPFKSRLS